jgi:S-adenosylmethionine hydrolase
MIQKEIYFLFITALILHGCESKKAAVVFQTDFGLKDGAVSAMKGVAMGVSDELNLFDLTHEIPAYNIWEAAFRLQQTAPYWPAGTVFVSVVDPGVGTNRRSIVLKSKSGQYFVSPDNGTLTLIAESTGIVSIREIDENLNRRVGSADSYTFHGRDVYAYTGARLAAGIIKYEQVGRILNNDSLVKISYPKPVIQKDSILGNIPVLDIQYGNVWTNIPDSLLKLQGMKAGDSLWITIYNQEELVHSAGYRFVHTFGEVGLGQSMAYLNSLLNLSIAINEGNLSDSLGVKSGPGWRVVVWKVSG